MPAPPMSIELVIDWLLSIDSIDYSPHLTAPAALLAEVLSIADILPTSDVARNVFRHLLVARGEFSEHERAVFEHAYGFARAILVAHEGPNAHPSPGDGLCPFCKGIFRCASDP